MMNDEWVTARDLSYYDQLEDNDTLNFQNFHGNKAIKNYTEKCTITHANLRSLDFSVAPDEEFNANWKY